MNVYEPCASRVLWSANSSVIYGFRSALIRANYTPAAGPVPYNPEKFFTDLLITSDIRIVTLAIITY